MISPLFKHFGSKWSATKRGCYPKALEGLPIFEPYAGSAGYSLNYPSHNVVLWDDDPMIAGLWKWLIEEATDNLIREIPINLDPGTNIRALGLQEGQALLLKHWQRTNNVGNCWTISPWGNKPGQWTTNTRARVAEEVSAIKHWKLQPIAVWSQPGTYFVDPPYEHNYRYRFPKNSFNFEALGQQCQRAPVGSLVIVCEAACSKTGALPAWLPFQASHAQVTSRRKTTQNHHSSELLWTNQP